MKFLQFRLKPIHPAYPLLAVEQNVRLALRLAQHGWVLESGRTAVTGTAAELRAHPELVPAISARAARLPSRIDRTAVIDAKIVLSAALRLDHPCSIPH